MKHITKGRFPFTVIGFPSKEYNDYNNNPEFMWDYSYLDRYSSNIFFGYFVHNLDVDNKWKNYLEDKQGEYYFLKTAKESFQSLMISEGIVLKLWIDIIPEALQSLKIDKYYEDLIILVKR